MVDNKEKDDDEIVVEIVEDDTDIDDSTPGEGIELNDDLFDDDSHKKQDEDADSDEEDEDDPDDVERKAMGKRAQKRIKQLLAKQRALETQLAERDNKLNQVASDSREHEYSEYERSLDWLDNREKELGEFEKTIEASYRSARNNDDVDAEWAAQKAMQQLQAERTSIVSRKEQFKRAIDQRKSDGKDDFARRPNSGNEGQPVNVDGGQDYVPQQAAPDRKAVDWWKRNPWFHGESHEERIMTTAALAINQELLDDGYNPDEDADEYYDALDKAIAAEFPKIKQGGRKVAKGSPVSGGGRGPRKAGKGKIKITESMKNRAERLGVPIEAYAKQVQKLRDEGRDI
jgi:hypothetical protein